MNDFKGLSRATSVIKTPEQMWQFARNIVLTNKYLSITNEKGNEYGYEVPGIMLGGIVTNEDIVYFTKDGIYSCIGYVNYLTQVYTPVVRTSNPKFQFNINSPIEGIYVYNYKKELIVVYSDGINTNSSTPKLVNLHNPQVKLSSSKEFIQSDDYIMFELFNHTELPVSDYSYQTGSLDAEVVHLAFCYVFDDNTDGLYSPIIETVYPNYKGYNTVKNNVHFKLSDLSKKFSKIKLAFIIKKSGGLFAYTTSILPIINNSVEYTLSSEEDLLIATPDEIVITSERFTKIRTITKTANQVNIGNVEKRNTENLQKYANKLKLSLSLLTKVEADDNKTHPTFLPDEVYSFRIIPIFLDGTKGDALHIPGRLPEGDEANVLLDSTAAYHGLDFAKYKGGKYRNFHIRNTGFANPTSAKWGYWQNEEKYPNKDYYDSSLIGGEDLRNTPIRYHKFPAPDDITYNANMFGASQGRPIVTDTMNEGIGNVPRFAIDVENFNEAFPSNIREQLQGYELVFEKRPRSGTYIEQYGLLYKAIIPAGREIPYTVEGDGSGMFTTDDNYKDFTVSNFISVETLKDRVDINANIIKIYYGIRTGKMILDSKQTKFLNATNTTVQPTLSTVYEKMASVEDAKYLLANNISSDNRFGEEQLQLTLKHLLAGDQSEDFIPLASGNPDLNILAASLITLNKNIYNLENNNDFISVGITHLNKPNKKLINGDVFATNIIKKTFSADYRGTSNNAVPVSIHNYMNFYIYNIYSSVSNHYIVNGVTTSRIPRKSSIGGLPNYINVFSSFLFGLKGVYKSWYTLDVNMMNSFDYSTTVKDKGVIKYFNDYIGAVPPALLSNFINYFPYRVYKGLAIPNESLQTKNLRFFPTNAYYDMRNDRGEIIALRGYNRGLYIQQRYSLFETTISDKLNANAEETYLGSSELFDRIPEEIYYNDNIGYIGSNSQYACIIFRDGYATVDEAQGKVFIVNKEMSEISLQNMKDSFKKILPLGEHYTKKDLLDKTVKIDNPFVSVGYILGFDEEYNRLLLTKKYYEPKNTLNGFSFDGEFYKDSLGKIIDFKNTAYFTDKSKTFSFALDSKTWVSEHDYFPNMYMYNNKGSYSIYNEVGKNAKLYKHNSDNVNPGNYYGKQFESYVDLIFNGRLDISKQYQAIYWVTEAFDIDTNTPLQFDTIDKIMLYNNHQCSGIVDVSKRSLKTARNTEGIWQFNEFRDMLVSPDKKILDDDGNLITNNIALSKQWYSKNMFFGNFIVVRMIWNNETKVLKHIHNVNVKSVNSQR